LGDLFLQKAFQLSIRMPQVSENNKKQFWNHILGLGQPKDSSLRQFEELGEKEQMELLKDIAEISDEKISTSEVLENLETKHRVSPDYLSSVAIDRKNESKKELNHLLQRFYDKLESNPRSIVRLANHYTMTRSTLIAERKDVKPELLFRWLLIKDLFQDAPLLMRKIKKSDDLKDHFQQLELPADKKEKCKALLEGENQHPLTLEIIKIIEGI
jgi:hypothetical protein